jgi:hypothetical protein
LKSSIGPYRGQKLQVSGLHKGSLIPCTSTRWCRIQLNVGIIDVLLINKCRSQHIRSVEMRM